MNPESGISAVFGIFRAVRCADCLQPSINHAPFRCNGLRIRDALNENTANPKYKFRLFTSPETKHSLLAFEDILCYNENIEKEGFSCLILNEFSRLRLRR